MVRRPSSCVRRRASLTRGASKLGCLGTLVLFVGTLYYGVQVGRIYWRYYALVDEMKAVARFAANRTDDAVRLTLVAKIDSLGLPPEAKRLIVRRGTLPNKIVIRTEYRERLELPFRSRYLVFRPQVEQVF